MDEFFVGALFDLLPEVVDIHVDDVGEFIEGAFPDGIGDHVLSNDLIRLTDKEFQCSEVRYFKKILCPFRTSYVLMSTPS